MTDHQHRFSQPLTRLIHENLSVVLTFVYSRPQIAAMRTAAFAGPWRVLERAIFTLPEQQANKACLEMALLLRMLDDEERISDYLDEVANNDFGTLDKRSGTVALDLRNVLNKIIHADRFEWFCSPARPKLICIPREDEKERWLKAEVDLVRLTGLLGNLAS